LYEDENIIAINKPHGLFVHRTALDRNANEFVLQILRDQIGQRVYPIHRLDRKTSGVLLLAKSPEIHKLFSLMWSERQVEKNYVAIVRGFTPESGLIDYALKNDAGTLQEAQTHYTTLYKSEIEMANGKFKGLLARAVFVVDQNNKICHVELTPEVGAEPDEVPEGRPIGSGLNKDTLIWLVVGAAFLGLLLWVLLS
jgi:23S rRNA-/tRNA-specific pseudouridylate synthase